MDSNSIRSRLLDYHVSRTKYEHTRALEHFIAKWEAIDQITRDVIMNMPDEFLTGIKIARRKARPAIDARVREWNMNFFTNRKMLSKELREIERMKSKAEREITRIETNKELDFKLKDHLCEIVGLLRKRERDFDSDEETGDENDKRMRYE